MVTPQDIQAGVATLGVIAETEAVEELEIFDAWTSHQKLRSLINGLRGHKGISLPRSPLLQYPKERSH